MSLQNSRYRSGNLFCALLLTAFTPTVQGIAPVVKTVRVLSSNPAVPHDVCSGVATRVKGTSDAQGANFQYTWDFGDGTPAATGTVNDMYAIEAAHTYTSASEIVYIARLTVRNTGTNEATTREYPVKVWPSCVLSVRVNAAIDEGLWYLHKTQTRAVSGTVPVGYWNSGSAGSGYYAVSATNVNAFEVNGFLKTGPADDPYTETVSRGLDRLFEYLTSGAIPNSQTNGRGSFNPDANGNGIGVSVNQTYPFYQGGPFVDAIVASQTPNALAPLGGANINGRTYKAIVQDMVDYFAYCQYDGTGGGGWRYNCQEFPDNSACQWVAIGAIPALRQFGVILPNIVRQWNTDWLTYSQDATVGAFGYTSALSSSWGPYAVTPSGMVQLAMDGIGRGAPGAPSWDKAETFMRDNFGNGGGPTTNPKAYYYGLFSFTKAMLLHDSNNDGVAEPLSLLRSTNLGTGCTDGLPAVGRLLRWYEGEQGADQGFSEAETGIPAGIPLCTAATNGIARTLVNDQSSAGYWIGHDYDGNQYPFETAWAVIMLRRTVVDIPPTARAEAFPNPVLPSQVVTFDGSTSTAGPGKAIVKWEWDLDNNGSFERVGVIVTRTFPSKGTYSVTLRVTDNSAPAGLIGTATIAVGVRDPPIAPTANAGGPYNFCTNRTPWFLDARGSINPDEGVSEPGKPGNTIIEYAWELNGNNMFDDASGLTPNVTNLFSVNAVPYLIQLRVTDNSGQSHPTSSGNLSDTDTAQVFVRNATDPACSCVTNLMARPKPGKADLTWTWRPGAVKYNVYRGTTSGGPYIRLGTVITAGLPNTGVYADLGPLTNGLTYYYVVREVAASNEELCQSNQAMATPVAR